MGMLHLGHCVKSGPFFLIELVHVSDRGVRAIDVQGLQRDFKLLHATSLSTVRHECVFRPISNVDLQSRDFDLDDGHCVG